MITLSPSFIYFLLYFSELSWSKQGGQNSEKRKNTEKEEKKIMKRNETPHACQVIRKNAAKHGACLSDQVRDSIYRDQNNKFYTSKISLGKMQNH